MKNQVVADTFTGIGLPQFAVRLALFLIPLYFSRCCCGVSKVRQARRGCLICIINERVGMIDHRHRTGASQSNVSLCKRLQAEGTMVQSPTYELSQFYTAEKVLDKRIIINVFSG